MGAFNQWVGGLIMQAAANQIRWVPIHEIVEPEEAGRGQEQEDGAVLLAPQEDGRYILLAGRERLRLLKEEGRCYVDAAVSRASELSERLSHLLDEQVRGRMHYLDEGEAYRAFVQFDGLNAQELAERTGRSVATVRKKIRLLNLGEEICALLREHGVSERIAEALLRMPGQQGRMRVMRHVIERGLTVKETEALIDDVLAHMPIPITGGRRMKPLMRDYRLYVNAIRGIVEQMRDAGLDARMQVNIGRRAVDVRVSVPLFTQVKG